MRTPLKPPPPYCSERPFHSTGRFTSKRIGGALGSTGSRCPSTLQKAGFAGAMRVAGVGARSETESDDGACNVLESMRTSPSPCPTRPPQVLAASPTIVAANPEDVAVKKANTATKEMRATTIASTMQFWPQPIKQYIQNPFALAVNQQRYTIRSY